MKLESIRVENVGGFVTAEFDLSESRVLVGENNSGKTSLLRILDWVFNGADEQLFRQRRALSEGEQKLLVPARMTRNKARRVFLRVHLTDGRVARGYHGRNGVAELRIQFRQSSTYAKLTAPTKGEAATSEPKALQLLLQLQRAYCAMYVPAARDSQSRLFKESLESAIASHLGKVLITQGRGRVPKQVATFKRVAGQLQNVGNGPVAEVWQQATTHLRGVFDPTASFRLEFTQDDLIDFLADHVKPTFSMGVHDKNGVGPDLLGSGTQSMLAIALTQLAFSASERQLLLLEEPEAFLHPGAQRALASQVLGAPGSLQMLITTHGPHVLAEAEPRNVVVLRKHGVFPAAAVTEMQESKDRNHLSTFAAEAMFDRSILLVEGPGDVAFFERLRRKLVGVIPIAVLSRLRVSAAGGKQSFGPWLRLLRRYRDPVSKMQAFHVLVCSDSSDAVADTLTAFKDSSVTVPLDVQNEAKAINNGLSLTPPNPAAADQIATRTQSVNRAAAIPETPIHFMPVDLEYGSTCRLSDARATEFAKMHGFSATSASQLASQLGSKGGQDNPSTKPGAKAPYLRADLAEFLTWDEVCDDIKNLIWRWIKPAYDDPAPVRPPELRSAS